MTKAIVELGHDVHGNEVVAARYVVAPNGGLILLQKHLPLKDGWRLATQSDIDAAEQRGRDAALAEQLEADKAFAEQSAESHLKGELERADAALQAERMVGKAAARKQKRLTMTDEEQRELSNKLEPANTSHEEIQQRLADAQQVAAIGSTRIADEITVELGVDPEKPKASESQ